MKIGGFGVVLVFFCGVLFLIYFKSRLCFVFWRCCLLVNLLCVGLVC